MTKHQKWVAYKRAHPGRCNCGRPAVQLKDGHEAVCEFCAHRYTGIKAERPIRLATKTAAERRAAQSANVLVDPFETRGRGWGTWDSFLQLHPEI